MNPKNKYTSTISPLGDGRFYWMIKEVDTPFSCGGIRDSRLECESEINSAIQTDEINRSLNINKRNSNG